MLLRIILHALGGYAVASLLWLFVGYAYTVPEFNLHTHHDERDECDERDEHSEHGERDEKNNAEAKTLLVYSLDSTLSPVSIPFHKNFETEYKKRMRDVGMSTKEMYDRTYYTNFIVYLFILSQVHIALTLFTVVAWLMSESDEETYHARVRSYVNQVMRTPFPFFIVTEGSRGNAEDELRRMGIDLERVVILATNGNKVNKGILVECWIERHYEDWKFNHNHSFGYVSPPLERVLLVDNDPEACKRATCKGLDMEVLPVGKMPGNGKTHREWSGGRLKPGLFQQHWIVNALRTVVRHQQI